MKIFETFLWKEKEPEIGLLTFNRPETLNSIDHKMLDDLDALFAELEKSESLRILIITGAGRGFCAGADLNAVSGLKETSALTNPEHFLRLVQERYSNIVFKLSHIPQIVIAAVNGPAAGGGFCVALGADIRLASPKAYFVASFINIGLSGVELGTSYFLPRFVGLSRASEILYTGRKVFAEEALQIGLVSKIVSDENLIESSLEIARLILTKDAAGVKSTKSILRQNVNAPLEAALALENRNQTIMVFSCDFAELIKSFAK